MSDPSTAMQFSLSDVVAVLKERDRRDRLLQFTLEACQEDSSRRGSRGRSRSHGSERMVPPGYCSTISWISRELGYVHHPHSSPRRAVPDCRNPSCAYFTADRSSFVRYQSSDGGYGRRLVIQLVDQPVDATRRHQR